MPIICAYSRLSTEGRRDKIVLLKGFNKIAPGIKALHLPTVSVQDLFRSEALVVSRDLVVPTVIAAPDLMTDGEEHTTAESVLSDDSSTHSLDRAERLLRKVFDGDGSVSLPGPRHNHEVSTNGPPQIAEPIKAAERGSALKRVPGSVRTLKPRPCHASVVDHCRVHVVS